MPADDAVLRSARNAFLVVIVLLLAVSVYQFVALGAVTEPVVALWLAGVGTYYASKYYYERRADSDDGAGDEMGPE